MIGWRARFGVMVPARNFTLEPELYKLVPEGVSLHFDRLRISPGAEGENPKQVEKRLKGYSEEVINCARNLSLIQPDVIAFGCTSGSLYAGPRYDQEIIQKVQDVTQIPVTTTSTAVIQALKELQIRRVTVVTPYISHLNNKVRSFLEVNGIETIRIKGLTNIGLKSMEMPERVYRLAREIDTAEATGIFISCTALRSIEIIEPLEEDTKKPVISSNQATLWMMMKMAKIHVPIKGYGCLLDS